MFVPTVTATVTADNLLAVRYRQNCLSQADHSSGLNVNLLGGGRFFIPTILTPCVVLN